MKREIDFIKRLYSLFNARDMDGVLTSLHPDVVWANGMEGGFVHGREGVREYWTRQWATIDPRVDPEAFSEGDAGRIAVEVHQVVRDLKGNLLADRKVGHLFRIEDGLVTHFEID